MRHPHRGRAIGLGCFAGGLVAVPAAFLLPAALAGETARGLLFVTGFSALLFGGGTALFRHRDVRAQARLARGEGILARWHVDADTWRAFVAHDRQLAREDRVLPNELSPGDTVPPAGIEVVVGEAAVQVGESIHTLPRRGTPEVTQAEVDRGRVRPSFVHFHLYYPGGGHGASGMPRPAVRTALRFPVPGSALPEAERAVAYYAAGRPGQPDVFHGPGDGTDPEDLAVCWRCAWETHALRSHCPRCGATMQTRRWSRRYGTVLFACGLVIALVMGLVLSATVPMLLRPGVDVGGTRFSGSPAQARVALVIMGGAAVFGVAAMAYGLWQRWTGRRARRVVHVMVGLVALLALIAWRM